MKLVLLPGLDGTGLLFKPLIKAFTQSVETQIISYPIDQKLNYQELYEYVSDRLPNEEYILVGESFSGYIAYQVALRKPENLKSIIFIASFLSSPRPILLSLLKYLPIKLLLSFQIPTFIIKIFLLDSAATKETIQLLKQTIQKLPADIISFRLNEINRIPTKLDASLIPAVYIQAYKDRLVPKESLETINLLFPNLSQEYIDAPHFCLQSNSIDCANIIQKHLGRISKSHE
ncbi:MAG: alpha/beta fold hydrolase [Cocleimonas sp.]